MPRRVRLLAAGAALSAAASWGQATEGRDLFTRPDKGDCISCHQVSGTGTAARANIGPRLDAARLKGWDRARLRELLEDPTRANPDTVMPPFGRHRILDVPEIELLIDYLHALR